MMLLFIVKKFACPSGCAGGAASAALQILAVAPLRLRLRLRFAPCSYCPASTTRPEKMVLTGPGAFSRKREPIFGKENEADVIRASKQVKKAADSACASVLTVSAPAALCNTGHLASIKVRQECSRCSIKENPDTDPIPSLDCTGFPCMFQWTPGKIRLESKIIEAVGIQNI